MGRGPPITLRANAAVILVISSPSDARNQTLFMILVDTGLRIGELVNLKVDDVQMEEGYLKVMGKGKKERIVPIGNNAQRELQRYLFRFRPKPNNPVLESIHELGHTHEGIPFTLEICLSSKPFSKSKLSSHIP